MAIKVHEALAILQAKGCELLAGAGGLDRVVRYVDALETPDMEMWMRPNVFYITTGYAYSANPQKILQLILHLHQAKAAALAIKPRFMEELPAQALQMAVELGLPLILIPAEVPFVELNYPLMEAIIQSRKRKPDTAPERPRSQQQSDKELFVALIAGKAGQTEEIQHRVEGLKWPAPPFQVALLEPDGSEKRQSDPAAAAADWPREGVEQALREHCERLWPGAVTVANQEAFVCILNNSAEEGQEAFLSVRQKVYEQTGCRLTIGVSGPGSAYQDFAGSYREAGEALAIARTERTEPRVVHFAEVSYWRLLKQVSGLPAAVAYVTEKLKALRAYDRQHESRLMETLAALVNNLGARSMTAARLYLHRNTLQYRIRKIESLTGYDLSCPDSILELSLALRLSRFL